MRARISIVQSGRADAALARVERNTSAGAIGHRPANTLRETGRHLPLDHQQIAPLLRQPPPQRVRKSAARPGSFASGGVVACLLLSVQHADRNLDWQVGPGCFRKNRRSVFSSKSRRSPAMAATVGDESALHAGQGRWVTLAPVHAVSDSRSIHASPRPLTPNHPAPRTAAASRQARQRPRAVNFNLRLGIGQQCHVSTHAPLPLDGDLARFAD